MSSLIHVAHARITSGTARTLQQLNADGSVVWTVDHGASCYCVDVDADGNVYTGGDISGGYTVRSYDAGGTLRWSADTAYSSGNYTVYGIRAGADGFVYTAQKYQAYIGDSSRTNVFKLDADDGAQSWAVGTFGHAYDVDVKSNSRVWVATGYSYDFYQINDIGVRDFRLSYAGTAYAVARIDDEYLMLGGTVTSSKTTWKLRSQNNTTPVTTIWSVNHGATVRAIAVDQTSGTIYTVGDRYATTPATTRAYDADGSLLWSADHGATVNAVAVDDDGSIYTGGVASGGYQIRHYSSAGTLLDSISIGATVYGLALTAIAGINTDAPALPFAVALAVPTLSASFVAPALPLAFALAVPAVSAYPLPPAVDHPGSVIYRLFLTVGDAVLELPLRSIQCRRTRGRSTWLTAETAGWSDEIESLVTSALGGIVLIDAGRSLDGVETRGEFLRAVLTEYSATRDAQRGSIVLTGRVQTPSYSAQTRALSGVQSLGYDNGRMTARCAVDPLLRPNDAVTHDGDIWSVSAINYRISSTDAWMEIIGSAD